MSRRKKTFAASIKFSRLQEQLILGSLLGDASLSKPPTGRNYHWAIYHAEAQSAYLRWKHDLLWPWSSPIQHCAYLDKRDGKTRIGGRFHLPSLPWLTELRSELYPSGTKTLTAAFLKRIKDPVALVTLIGDDGHWDKAGVQIASKQFSRDENDLLATWLRSRYGLVCSVEPTGKYWHVRIPCISVARVRLLCMKRMISSLWYKIGGSSYETRFIGKECFRCEICQTTFLAYTSAGRRFCSPECGVKGRASAWPARRKRYGANGCIDATATLEKSWATRRANAAVSTIHPLRDSW